MAVWVGVGVFGCGRHLTVGAEVGLAGAHFAPSHWHDGRTMGHHKLEVCGSTLRAAAYRWCRRVHTVQRATVFTTVRYLPTLCIIIMHHSTPSELALHSPMRSESSSPC